MQVKHRFLLSGKETLLLLCMKSIALCVVCKNERVNKGPCIHTLICFVYDAPCPDQALFRNRENCLQELNSPT